MFDRLRGHFGAQDAIRLIASLILALLLWGWVTNLKDPEETLTFYNVEIQQGTAPEGLQIVTALPQATVRISGPRSIVSGLTQSDLQLRLDLSGIKGAGTSTVPVKLKAPDGVRTRSVIPKQVEITVEKTVSVQFPLTAKKPDLNGDPRQVGDITPAVSEVTVVGAQSQVARVAKVVLPIDLGNHTQDFRDDFKPVALDKGGQAIPEVTISPATVSAFVPIRARGKSVAVLTQVVGEPADGYEVGDKTVNPPTVLIDGPRAALDKVFAVNAAPINIEGAKDTVAAHLPIVGLPDGVRVINPADGSVDVVVQIRQHAVPQQLPSQPVEVIGLLPGYTATVNPQTVQVVLLASEDTLAHLKTGDIKISVDVSGLKPGQTYSLTPSVTVPPNVQWTVTDPQLVQVSIAAKPAASPAASPGASPPAATPAPAATP